MRKLIISAACIATALISIGCAKQPKVGPNDANKRYLEAWLHINGINVEPSGRGIYVIENSEGNGRAVEKEGFAFLEYTTTDLDGNITSYTNAETAKKLGEYSESTYYGPTVVNTYDGNIYAGVADMLLGMKVGGRKKVIIPGWLLSYKDYETESEYLAASSSMESLIYDIKVKGFTNDMNKWETDSMCRFFANDKILIDGLPADEVFLNEDGHSMTIKDTIQEGFWYRQLKAPVDTAKFPSDTTIYINYTGMTLDGKVFDTTFEDVAKDFGIYSSSRTYEPVQIKWPNTDEDYTSITMGDDESEIIPGFALTLWQMRAMESGIGVFYSTLGYGASGSGASIPSYAPLIFKIEIVEEPEE